LCVVEAGKELDERLEEKYITEAENEYNKIGEKLQRQKNITRA
jgi:hypothetical protein